MQVVPMLGAASASLSAPTAGQAEPGALPEAFGQLLLALLTATPVGIDASVASEGDEGHTQDTGVAKGSADPDQPEEADTLLAGLGAVVAPYVVPAAEAQPPQPDADASPAELDVAPRQALSPTAALAVPVVVSSARPESSLAPAETAAFARTLEPAIDPQADTGPTTNRESAANTDDEDQSLTALRWFAVGDGEADDSTATVARTAAGTHAAAGRDLSALADDGQARQPVVMPVTRPVDDATREPTSIDPSIALDEAVDAAAPLEARPATYPTDESAESYAQVAAAKRLATTAASETAAVAAAPVEAAADSAPAAEAPREASTSHVRPAELLDRIAGQIRVSAEVGGGEATLKLEPESLGRLEISVRVVDGQVSLSLSADSSAVQHVLADRLPDLVSALSASGMSVAQANVDLGDEARRQQSWGQATAHNGPSAEDDSIEAASSNEWLKPTSFLDVQV